MQEPSAIHSTFVIERSYPKPLKAAFALAEAAKKQPWFAQGESHEMQKFKLDFRVGGRERLIYRLKAGTPVAGMMLTNESGYQDIVPERRIVVA